MSDFRIGHAAGADWRGAAEACLQQMGSGSGTLGFLYVTDVIEAHYAEILRLFRAHTGIEHWVGAAGIGVCATGTEYLDQPAIAAMVGDFDADSFRVFSGVANEKDAAKIALECGGASPNFAIVHADPHTEGMEKLVTALAKRVESGFLVGGLVRKQL
ncbi:MAG TPA: FIST N-terminal domain-containing protein, partial [Burkholderiales bacterium]|nr:FIST N-terminal domain-containing protein [Burkholderiales bacterium]